MGVWPEQVALLQPTTRAERTDGATSGLASLKADSSILHALLQDINEKNVCTAADFYRHVSDKVEALVQQAVADSPTATNAAVLQLLAAGAACLQVVVQHNVTGPWQPAPPSPIEVLAPQLISCPATDGAEQQPVSGASASPTAEPSSVSAQLGEPVAEYNTHTASGRDATGLGVDSQHPHEKWAGKQLALDGEELLGSCAALQYMLLAEILLVEPLLGKAQHVQAQDSTSTAADSADKADVITTSAADTSGQSSSHKKLPTWQEKVREVLLPLWPSWAWWALRATLLHQQLLEGRSAQLWTRTQLLTQHLLSNWALPAVSGLFPSGTQPASGPLVATSSASQQCDQECVEGLASDAALLAALLLELAQGQHSAGYVEPAERLLADAGAVLGLQLQLTGALGKRTVHQVDAKAQLVVTATRERTARAAAVLQDANNNPDVETGSLGLGLGSKATASSGATASSASAGGSGSSTGAGKETEGLQLEEDVLLVPKLVDESGQELANVYVGCEQALLLSWATHIQRGTSQDELQAWQMAPYVEAVLQQPRSQYMLQAHAHLLKIRHEKGRNRTRERALLYMELLVEALQKLPAVSAETPTTDTASQQGSTPSAYADAMEVALQRQPFLYCLPFPLASRLQKELAEQYLALGFVGAAVKMFEALEAWGALVLCYRLLEKKHLAEQIIRKRLEVTPDDPALWCGLGDLHMEDSYYETAWQRSGCRHARSKRSLGRSALRRKDWPAAVQHYEAALALNPLNPDAWFALGYAYLKLPNCHMKALKAFTRVTQQQPDHGEAWNNMAALWLDLGRHKEALSALNQCVKHKRDSWQIWENYAAVAVKAGELLQAVKGLQQVLQVTGGQRLPVDTVQAVVDALAAAADTHLSNGHGSGASTPGDTDGGVPSAQDQEEEDLGAWIMDLPGVRGAPMTDPLSEESSVDHEDRADGQQHRGASSYQESLQKAKEQTMAQVKRQLGVLLKGAVNSPCCSPGLWGCLGTYYSVMGEQESAKEALLKQVRALSGTSYKSDEKRFTAMATASIALAKAYVQLYKANAAATGPDANSAGVQPNTRALRELGAARMHLRGVLKQSEQAFQEHEHWQQMEHMLQEVVTLEEQANGSAQAQQHDL